jgi:type I restriction enzyme M protein
MSPETHSQLANFIWGICNLLRGPYKRNEYRKVILPLTVLRRFDCLLATTKERALKEHAKIKGRPDTVIRSLLQKVTGRPFYNLSKLDMAKLLDDPNQLAPNLNSYINAFSKNVREIMERFAFDQQITRMAEKNLLYEVVKAFANVDLSPERVDNTQMGYIFEELIRIGAEQSNEEAGEHFTPREVIKLMVNLLLSPEKDLRRSHVVKTIYDPACGTGGMLSVAEKYIRDLNSEANPLLFGQDWNDEAWAVCKSDMLIKGEDADNIILGDTFSKDGFADDKDGKKITFDYMLANPPFGVEWKQQATFIDKEHKTLGHHGRFGAGLPRINDGALLFLQHMLSKRRAPKEGGSRIGIVFNGSPLFTGDAGSGESNIRQWIIENDWLEAIVALPDQLFYNTGISTYLWILTNRKERERKGKIQLIDARQFYVKMRKSLGNKRNKIGDKDENEPDQIGEITRIFGNFRDCETREFVIPAQAGIQAKKTLVVSKIFDNADFGYHKITVERPLRLNFRATEERIARLDEESGFKNLATSNKKNEKVRLQEIEVGKKRQDEIRNLLRAFGGRQREIQSKVDGRTESSTVHEAAEHYSALSSASVTPAESLPGTRSRADVQYFPKNLDAGVHRHDGKTSPHLYMNRKDFIADLKSLDSELGVRLTASELKAVINALGERDETAEICRDRDGNPEPDPELRDTETVPLKESIDEYLKREVLPHAPDARVDESKTKVGYEIPLNRHFYRYEPPRPLEEIAADIKELESDILSMLKEVAG